MKLGFSERRAKRMTPDGATSYLYIYPERFGADTWSQSLGNPCHATEPPSTFENDTVLNMDGKVWELRHWAVTGQRRVRNLNALFRIHECPTHMDTLPRLPTSLTFVEGSKVEFTQSLMEDLYETFYQLGAHFRIMHRNWVEGRSCERFPEPIWEQVEKMSIKFRNGMCTLMEPAEPHPRASAYPSRILRLKYYRNIEVLMWHYRDCSGRRMRDCIVMSQAKHVFDFLERISRE